MLPTRVFWNVAASPYQGEIYLLTLTSLLILTKMLKIRFYVETMSILI